MSNWAEDQASFMRAGDQTVGTFNIEQAQRYAMHLKEEAMEAMGAVWAGEWVDAVDGAVDSIVVALGLLHSLGVDPDKAWDIVHAANMRKVVDGKVYRREDNQIGKPPGWTGPEPELKLLVDAVLS